MNRVTVEDENTFGVCDTLELENVVKMSDEQLASELDTWRCMNSYGDEDYEYEIGCSIRLIERQISLRREKDFVVRAIHEVCVNDGDARGMLEYGAELARRSGQPIQDLNDRIVGTAGDDVDTAGLQDSVLPLDLGRLSAFPSAS